MAEILSFLAGVIIVLVFIKVGESTNNDDDKQ